MLSGQIRIGLALVLLAVTPRAAGARNAPLAPGRTVERRIVPGEAHRWEVACRAGRAWRLRVRQLGVDLAIEVREPGGESLGVANGPVDRRGEETLLVEPAADGVCRIEVGTTTPGAAAGRYELLLELIPNGVPAERVMAERAMTVAAHHAAGDLGSRRAAFTSYREAFGHWQILADGRGAARALHAMALLCKELRDDDGCRDRSDLLSRAAGLWRELGETGLRALALGELAVAELERGATEDARALLGQALALNREAGQDFEAAGNRMDLGFVAQRQGALHEALESYDEALRLYRSAGDATYEAVLLSNRGGVYWQLGEAAPALEDYGRSLALHRAAGDRRQVARVLNNLAALHRSLGDGEHALALYDEAGRLYVELGDRRGEARVLNNTGFAYEELGEPERARGYFLRALELRDELGDRRGVAATLSNLGHLHELRDELPEALSYYRRSLLLKQELGDRRGESSLASLLGRTLARLGEAEAAREHFLQARRWIADMGDAAGEARLLLRQAEAWLELGDVEPAQSTAARAVALYRGLDDSAALVEALAVLARAHRAGEHLAEAREILEEALGRVESLRGGLDNPSFRSTFLGAQSSLWELHVDLLAEMHRRHPEAGFERAALEAAERSRARGLLDLLAEAGAELRQGFEPALVERRGALVRRLGLLAERREDASPDPERAAALEEVLAQLDLVEAEMRHRHPRFAALTRPRPLSAGAMQELIDAETVLLYYALGQRRSFLWVVRAEAIDLHELPPRRLVEDAARLAYQELATYRPLARRESGALVALSAIVLGPLAGRLGPGERILVVADGALHWVPFAALPLPSGSGRAGRRLVEDHEVTHLPSISVLEALVEPAASPASATGSRLLGPRSVAVVADPVFDVCDPRVRADPRRCSAETRTPYERLPGSRREAEAIAALAGNGEALVALDFEAARELVAKGRLERYRFVHFATHGVVDTDNPRLSGLVLSGSDAHGRPRDAVLRLDEIYNLELAAEAVVLSGCRTALGRELRGEGLVGLVRGFLYAGARQVVASLWRVDDDATVELMRHFYGAALDQGLAPAAALRSAQLAMAREPRWSDPYFWAAFVVQGAGRPGETPRAESTVLQRSR